MENIIYFLYKAFVTINRNTERTKEVLNAAKLFLGLKTLSLIVRTLLLVTLQLIIYESAKKRVLHTFGKNCIQYQIYKFFHRYESQE